MTRIKNAGLVSAIVALATVAACSNKQEPKVDPSLKADLAAVGGSANDLQLAPSSAKASVVVSAIEGGPQSAPKRVAKAPTPKPVQHKAPPAAAREPRVTAPAPTSVASVEQAAAPVAPVEQPAVQAPRPVPAQAPQQDHRVYKTEAEVFSKMPWIRP
jgi:hypothetical protein